VARINLDQKLLDSLDLLETTIEEVPVKDLEIDPRIQRALDRNKILASTSSSSSQHSTSSPCPGVPTARLWFWTDSTAWRW